jgi:hypothetical protein
MPKIISAISADWKRDTAGTRYSWSMIKIFISDVAKKHYRHGSGHIAVK